MKLGDPPKFMSILGEGLPSPLIFQLLSTHRVSHLNLTLEHTRTPPIALLRILVLLFVVLQ